MKYDAERDLSDIGAGDKVEVFFLSKMKYAKINSAVNNNVKKGVLFSTYSALIGESQAGGKYKSRLKQILHWSVYSLFNINFLIKKCAGVEMTLTVALFLTSAIKPKTFAPVEQESQPRQGR